MHTEPNRPSPSFHQIPEGGVVEVLAHRVTPRSCSPSERGRAGKGGCSSKSLQAQGA